jgi:hypothetical protein
MLYLDKLTSVFLANKKSGEKGMVSQTDPQMVQKLIYGKNRD